VVGEAGEVAVGGEGLVLGRARLGRSESAPRRRRGGVLAAGAAAGAGGAGGAEAAAAGGAEGGAGAGVDAGAHAGEAVGPLGAAGAALLLEEGAVGAALVEADEGDGGHGGDGPVEAEGAPVALGDGPDGLHGAVVRQAPGEASVCGLGDALAACLALLVEGAVVKLRTTDVVACPLGARRRGWRRRSLRRHSRCRCPGVEPARKVQGEFEMDLAASRPKPLCSDVSRESWIYLFRGVTGDLRLDLAIIDPDGFWSCLILNDVLRLGTVSWIFAGNESIIRKWMIAGAGYSRDR
jgi:hypothetical protein